MRPTRRRLLAQLSATLTLAACAGPTGKPGGGGGTPDDDSGGADGADGSGDGADGADGGDTSDSGGSGADGGDTSDTADTGDTGSFDWRAECDMSTRPLPNCTDPTPRIPEGPYYREGVPVRDELNITGESGTPLVFQGRVLGPECAALSADFEVVIWHARQDGTYDFTGTDFQAYGRVQPAADGTFCVSTLVPPSYMDGPNLIPQHIHVAVLREGVRVFTTQVYFDGDPALASSPAPAQCIRGVESLPGGAKRVAMDIVLDGPSAGL